MITEEVHVVAVVKIIGFATASIFSAFYTMLGAVAGVEGSNTIAIGTTLAVSVSFAGLILRMVIKNQGAIWDIVRAKDKEIYQIKLEMEYAEWEREQARYRAKERTDPGPFSPSLRISNFHRDTTN